MKLLKREIENKNFFFFDNKYFEILKKIVKNEYIVEEEFKNDKRTYVAKILIDDRYYILKKFYLRSNLKKFLSAFKKGESLSTFLNINLFRSNGLKELVPILGAMIERKNKIITEEMILMEYVEGEKISTDRNLLKLLKTLDKIYSLRRYHGDCNPGNFILDKNNNIRIIDTKLKKMYFGDYRKHYDILTLIKYFTVKIEYPYNKNIFYYIAYGIRKIRDIKNFLRRD